MKPKYPSRQSLSRDNPFSTPRFGGAGGARPSLSPETFSPGPGGSLAPRQAAPIDDPRSDAPAPGHPPGHQGDEEELQGVYIISVAARILEMHPQTLRKYERVGLVTPSRTVGMLRLYSREDIARLRLIKHLVDELRLNLAGVQLALGMFNHLLLIRSRLSGLPGTPHKSLLEDSLEEMLELLHTRLG